MTNVFFYQSLEELKWRSAKPWHILRFTPNKDVNHNRVWNFLHTLDGDVGIRLSHDLGDSESVTLQFTNLVDKTKFELHAKLSDWIAPEVVGFSWNDINMNTQTLSKAYVRQLLGLDPPSDDL